VLKTGGNGSSASSYSSGRCIIPFSQEKQEASAATKVDGIIKWLEDNGKGLPTPKNGRKPTKQELKDHLVTLDDESTYSIVDIAKENGDHEIFRTPPYHCELQPIEKI